MFRSDEFLYDAPNINPGSLKILFMDIDGVLQPIGNQKRFRHDLKALHNHFISINKKYENIDRFDLGAVYFDWDLQSVAFLKVLLEETKTSVVLLSGWRNDYSLEEIKLLFAIHGLDQYILDCCQSDSNNRDYTKEMAINDYLSTHKVDCAAVVDDCALLSFGEKMRTTRNYIRHSDYLYLVEALSSKTIIEKENTIRISNKETEIVFEYSTTEDGQETNIRILFAEFSHRWPDNDEQGTLKLFNSKPLLEFSLNYLIKRFKTPFLNVHFGSFNSLYFEDLCINAIPLDKKYDNCISYRSETYEMVNKVGLRK